ncbi:outer membrane homotrimeric porin [uncultured Desulfovibrio sp.]|uniref:outer membrane homotrimeric porin n=2 Tax=uncultured Desulfovibrio sp. TaxID=167968 RepID=UPI00266F86A1|nr:outer membrane homotrimeric porin [uncultured Desulfovibrio sp.]
MFSCFCGSRKRVMAFMAASLAGVALLVAPSGAEAIDFKARGWWLFSAQYGQNGNFSNKGHTGYDSLEDDFEARSRVRLQLDAVASESLSGQLYFEIGKFIWGKAGNPQGGGALGADSSDLIKLKRAYIDWMVPNTDLSVRMGIQAFRSPFFALDGPTVLTADGAGVTASYKINDNAGLTGFWMRPYNDNYISGSGRQNGFLDNVDFAGLLVPLRSDGWAMTPWGVYGAIGPNTFRTGKNPAPGENSFFGQRINGVDGNYFYSGMFPLLADKTAINRKTPSQYGNAWWAGLTGELTMWDPLRIAWEFTYGGVSWMDDPAMDRKGWMGALLFEYKTGWGVPGIYGWYASGDDDDVGNGSERMPYIVNDFGVSGFSSTFAGPDINGLERDRVLANTLIGTWGVGARLKNVSFFHNLRHTLHVSLWGGTNSSGILEKIHDRTGKWMSPNVNDNTGFKVPVGRDNMYLTDKDYALELGLLNQYKIYENLSVNLEAGYVHLMLDKSDDTWGLAATGGGKRGIRDAWNVSALFIYSF